MELDWLEDFLEVAAVRSFSAAAAARNISQSAFSRRIKALETWLGADLLDRGSYPIRLTPAGKMLVPRCQQLVRELHRIRIDCSDAAGSSLPLVSFAALTTLAVYFFPRWSDMLLAEGATFRSSVQVGDYRQSLEVLTSGRAEFAILYHHVDRPNVLGTGQFESKCIGHDTLALLSGTNEDGVPLYDDKRLDQPDVPYLTYSWSEVYFDKLIALIRARRRKPLNLTTVYQSTLAEAIKHMAIAGRGVAWLPRICAADALKRGELVPVGGDLLSTEMEIRIYRRLGHHSPESESIWAMIPGEPAVEAGAG